MGKQPWNEGEKPKQPPRRHTAPQIEEKETVKTNKNVEANANKEADEQVAAANDVKQKEDMQNTKSEDISSVVTKKEGSIPMKEKLLELLPEKQEMQSISLNLSSKAVKLLDEYCSANNQKRSPVIDMLIKQVFE